MNLTPASSSDLPSEAILTRVSESGTRLMQTAIFMREASVSGCQSSGHLQPLPLEGGRRVGRRVVGEPARRVRLVAPEPLAAHVAPVDAEPQRRTGRAADDKRHRNPRIRPVIGNKRKRVAGDDDLPCWVARSGEVYGAVECRRGISVIRVRPQPPPPPAPPPPPPPAGP